MNKSRKFAALIIITIIFTAFGGSLRAQDADDNEEQGLYVAQPRIFYAGLVAGANFAQVDGDYFAGYRKIGANFGGIGYVQFAKHVALSWEILYSQKGAKSNIVRLSNLIDSVYITKYGISVNYAEIPVMINYFDKRKSHFGVGVSYSRLVNSSESLQTDPVYAIDLNKYPFQKNNMDFLAGAQLHLWKGLFFNIRFQYSLIPMRTNSPPGFSRVNQQYNNLWTVRMMYLFI